jgi:hypothetical protein
MLPLIMNELLCSYWPGMKYTVRYSNSCVAPSKMLFRPGDDSSLIQLIVSGQQLICGIGQLSANDYLQLSRHPQELLESPSSREH